MKQSDFLNDKFTPAALPDICAPRYELLNAFHKASGKRLIVLSAPAGYGKTVSTLLWLRDCGRRVIWIGLDSYDNTPDIFYKLFCQGLLSAQPDNKNMNSILRSESFSSSPVEHTVSLISEFTIDDTLFALVLDDMHLVTNEEVRKSLPFIIKRLPNAFLTLILSRNEPSEEIAAHEKTGKAFFIKESHLTFSEEEIRKYFASLGRFLSAHEAEAVYAITGGWAIGINAIAKSGNIEIGQSNGLLLENYIKKQIWYKWDEDLRDFILKTSVADEMPIELCKRLTGREDSKEILGNLCSENSFVSKLSGDTYRYHHLFLDFIRNLSNQIPDETLKLLYKTASDYYFENQMLTHAAVMCIKGGDYAALIPIYDKLNEYNAHSPSIAEHINNINVFDIEQLANQDTAISPYMYLRCLWKFYLLGDAEKMFMYFDRYYEFAEKNKITNEILLRTAAMGTFLDHRKTIKEHMDMMARSPIIQTENEITYIPTFTQNMPFTHRCQRDCSEYAADIEGYTQQFYDTVGRLLGSKINNIYKDQVKAEMYFEKNMLKEAMQSAMMVSQNPHLKELPDFAFTNMNIFSAIYNAMGKKEELLRNIAETEKNINKLDANYLLPNFLAYKTKMLLWSGDKTAAQTWLDNYFVIETDHLELYKIYQHFTTARAYLALGQTDKAMSYILKLKQLGMDFCRSLDIAEASVLQLVLEWALGQKKEAQLTLEIVLTDMQNYGFIRVIADEGAAILPVLKKVISKVKKDDYNGVLDLRYLNDVYLAAYEQAKRGKGITGAITAKPIKLSKQQKLMLTLLSQGYKNSEIIEKTGLTINTVKAHTRIAYEKLDVNNAVDAVLKARELGIIEQTKDRLAGGFSCTRETTSFKA